MEHNRPTIHQPIGVLLLDTVGTAGHAVRLSRCWERESALIIGAGPIGIGALLGMKA